MFRDILVSLVNLRDADAAASLDGIAAAAAVLKGGVTGIAVELRFDEPVYMYADAVAYMSQAFIDAEKDHHARLVDLLQRFRQRMEAAGVGADAELFRAVAGDIPGLLARRARLHDLAMFILDDDDAYARACVEAVIFEAGRPVLVLPRGVTARPMKHVLVAWDFTREAARAFADAMPILRQAETVTLLHVADDGAGVHPQAAALDRHLDRLGIGARLVQVARGGLAVDQVLRNHAAGHGADLLVMGAYGHARLRELVLGGVTREVLKRPFLPVLLAH